MRRTAFFLLLFVCILEWPSALTAKECCDEFLNGRIAKNDKRYSTFKRAFALIEERNAQVLVETGTARNGLANCVGDGCSTVIFAEWACAHNAQFYSVDIDPVAVTISRTAAGNVLTPKGYWLENIHVACQDSVAFLAAFDKEIDFLYLDSYDFDVKNPSPSQEHHLKEIIAAYPHLSKNCVVMIDDCDLPFGGKGVLVTRYLISKGWKVVASEYQTLLINPKK